ncbi:MAG: isoprenylcysteine carboxylmethyltransferase family protein [Patescibacteria group bacterium]
MNAIAIVKRLALGIIISSIVVILPVAGNAAMFFSLHLWIVLTIGILASVFQPSYNPFTIASRIGDKGTGAQIIWSVYLTQLAAMLEAAYLRYPRSVEWDSVAVVALAVALFGLFARTWAVFVLGDFFTMHIAVGENHGIVRAGPYAVIRHPSYLGAVLLYWALPVFLHAWLAAVAAAIILPFAFVRRIHVEETTLMEKFGAEYKSYCAKTWKILPGIW